MPPTCVRARNVSRSYDVVTAPPSTGHRSKYPALSPPMIDEKMGGESGRGAPSQTIRALESSSARAR